jgi:hypothetical protein
MNVLRTRRKVNSAPFPLAEADGALISLNSRMILSETPEHFGIMLRLAATPGCRAAVTLGGRGVWRHRGGAT